MIRYFESEQSQISAETYLAIGLACSGMRNEAGFDYALFMISMPASGTGKANISLERVAAALHWEWHHKDSYNDKQQLV